MLLKHLAPSLYVISQTLNCRIIDNLKQTYYRQIRASDENTSDIGLMTAGQQICMTAGEQACSRLGATCALHYCCYCRLQSMFFCVGGWGGRGGCLLSRHCFYKMAKTVGWLSIVPDCGNPQWNVCNCPYRT